MNDWTSYALAPWVGGLRRAREITGQPPPYGWLAPVPEEVLDRAPYPINALLQEYWGRGLIQALRGLRERILVTLDLEDSSLQDLARGLQARFTFDHVAAPLWAGPFGSSVRIRVVRTWKFQFQVVIETPSRGQGLGVVLPWSRAVVRHIPWDLLMEVLTLGHLFHLVMLVSDYIAVARGEPMAAPEDAPPPHAPVTVGFGVQARVLDLHRNLVTGLRVTVDAALALMRTGRIPFSPLCQALVRGMTELEGLTLLALTEPEIIRPEDLDRMLQGLLA